VKQISHESAVRSIVLESEAILKMAETVKSDAFAAAVDALALCGRVMTCASGSSGAAAKKFAHSLCCIERGAMFMPPSEAVHGGLGALKKDDVMVMISRGGKTTELLPIINVCKIKGATLIAVTENMESPLAQAADIILPLVVGHETDKLDAMSTASYVATIALFDALLCALIEETDYTKEQFALIHPGGAVGERLNNGKTIAPNRRP
jgi:D-arabinose 5-phosphate isomerase GutQ